MWVLTANASFFINRQSSGGGGGNGGGIRTISGNSRTHTHPNEMRNDQKQTPFTTILLQCFGVVFRQHKSELHRNEWVPNECPRCAADIRNYLIASSLRSHTQINVVRCVCARKLCNYPRRQRRRDCDFFHHDKQLVFICLAGVHEVAHFKGIMCYMRSRHKITLPNICKAK